ncbi:hypothetical protein RFI_25265, partial [Reticulomyxa filosa]
DRVQHKYLRNEHDEIVEHMAMEIEAKEKPASNDMEAKDDKSGGEELGGEESVMHFSNAKRCEQMMEMVLSASPSVPSLQNGVDFLLANENDKKILLKNNEWNNFKFGVYLIGEKVTLTVKYNKKKELGHLKIKTSHLWIKDCKSAIDCSGLGCEATQNNCDGGGGGYGSKGEEFDVTRGHGKGGDVYGEQTLLKQIFCGSGGGSAHFVDGSKHKGGRGGGIIELQIEQHLLNYGAIRSNGNDTKIKWSEGGGGSGGSILIDFLSPSYHNTLQHVLGMITCIGGNQVYTCSNKGGFGRIAIYGIHVSTEAMANICPKPFHSIRKHNLISIAPE